MWIFSIYPSHSYDVTFPPEADKKKFFQPATLYWRCWKLRVRNF